MTVLWLERVGKSTGGAKRSGAPGVGPLMSSSPGTGRPSFRVELGRCGMRFQRDRIITGGRNRGRRFALPPSTMALVLRTGRKTAKHQSGRAAAETFTLRNDFGNTPSRRLLPIRRACLLVVLPT